MQTLGLYQPADWSSEAKSISTLSIDQAIRLFESVHETLSGISVTPENCMQSPTVHAVITGMTRLLISCPVHVYQKSTSDGRAAKEILGNHPVEKLLGKPNEWQTRVDYWQDATSALIRYGQYFDFMARGKTGPIRRLIPLNPGACTIKQDDNFNVTVDVNQATGAPKTYQLSELHYARGPARDFLKGDSPINDCREAIALEIAAEKFGASFFGGGAMPGIIFKFAEGFQAFKTNEERQKFVEDFQKSFSGKGRFKAALPPKGVEIGQAFGVENDKAQFLETRKYQRTVIAGMLGIPLYMVGDLDRQTFNNSEQQSINKVAEAGLPIVRILEASMERDFLTQDDRNGGVIIRFNMDGPLRGDFLARQQGLQIQRMNGVINGNDWRETENMNPISKADGGDEYWRQGPSGQSGIPKPGGANADPNPKP